jgi:hypothetical protein
MRCIGAKASRGRQPTRAARDATIRRPTPSPAQGDVGAGASASDQRVCANSWSSLTSARSIAATNPRGRIANTSRAARLCTTVSFLRLSTIAAAIGP